MNIQASVIRALTEKYPTIVPHLKGKSRWIAFTSLPVKKYKFLRMGSILEELHLLPYGELKTYDYYVRELERMIRNVYAGNLGGEFIDIMANLISGQLTQAFEQAWTDEEGEGDLPDYLTGALEDMVLGQYDHVDQLYRDIVDARVDETPIDPLLARAGLWAERWTEAYNRAVALIASANGGNLVWRLGETEEHCETCAGLNGIVARATEWESLGVHPQGAPNGLLTCGGWRCDCSLESTDKRRSPRAFESIMNAVQKG